jgi:hypothetical protein
MTVYANGLEVACKAQANKVIAAFPDTCFTPPQTPATPPGVPIPYPSFGMDSDTTSGTSTVKIGGETVTQKNKSYYSKTTGTEAGCAPKKNVITSVNTGKEFAHAWSGDVKMDGEPVSRFSDISSNDHASPTGGTPPFPKIGKLAGVFYSTEKCMIGTYDAIVDACNKAGGEAHHIVPDKVYRTGTRAQAEAGVTSNRVDGAPSIGDGVCICLSPKNHEKIHESEREAMDAVGKAGTEGLKGKALQKKKDQLKKSGDWGTGSSDDVHEAAKSSLDDLDLPASCIKKAKEAVDNQAAGLDGDQTLRTSNALPNRAAKRAMMNS